MAQQFFLILDENRDPIATFDDQEDAVEYAEELAIENPNQTIYILKTIRAFHTSVPIIEETLEVTPKRNEKTVYGENSGAVEFVSVLGDAIQTMTEKIRQTSPARQN